MKIKKTVLEIVYCYTVVTLLRDHSVRKTPEEHALPATRTTWQALVNCKLSRKGSGKLTGHGKVTELGNLALFSRISEGTSVSGQRNCTHHLSTIIA